MIVSRYTRWFGSVVVCLALVGMTGCSGGKKVEKKAKGAAKSTQAQGKKAQGKKVAAKKGLPGRKVNQGDLNKLRAQKGKIFGKHRKDAFYKDAAQRRATINNKYNLTWKELVQKAKGGTQIAKNMAVAEKDLENSKKALAAAGKSGKKLGNDERGRLVAARNSAGKRIKEITKKGNQLLKGNKALREARVARATAIDKLEAEISDFLKSKGHNDIVNAEKEILAALAAGAGKPNKKAAKSKVAGNQAGAKKG